MESLWVYCWLGVAERRFIVGFMVKVLWWYFVWGLFSELFLYCLSLG